MVSDAVQAARAQAAKVKADDAAAAEAANKAKADAAAKAKADAAAKAKAEAAAKAKADAAAKANATAAQTASVAPVKAPADFAAEYGVQAALVNSDPQLRALFEQAVADGWSAAKFQSAFRNTSWYLNNSDTWRVAETARTTDPASWNQQLGLAAEAIRRQTVALGFSLDEAQIQSLANQSLYVSGGTAANVSPDWLKSQVVEMGRITGAGGTSLQLIDTLKTAAYKNGVAYNDGWYEAAAKDVLMGTGAANEYEKLIKDAAKSKYAALAPQIDAGMNVMDIASPYFQLAATKLERDQNTITLDDPLIQRALTSLNEKGEPQIKALWQFEQDLKKDDRYFQTNGAHREFLDVATEIARQYGKAV